MVFQACPECGSKVQLVREHAAMSLGARTATIEVERYRCDGCGEIFYTPEQMDTAQVTLAKTLRAQEGLLSPQEIREFRERVGLTQVLFEQLLGVGPKTVVRWERGTIFQSRAVDELIRIIASVPGALEFLATKNGVKLVRLECPIPTKPNTHEVRYRMTSPPLPRKVRESVADFVAFEEGMARRRLPVKPEPEEQLPNIPEEALQ